MNKVLATSVIALLLLGCSSDRQAVPDETLTSLQNDSELLALLKDAIRNNPGTQYFYGVPEVSADMLLAGSATLVSTTNLQVSGVDEPDLVKNDNSHLFIGVRGDATYDYITPFVGVVSTDVMPYIQPALTPNRVRILSMSANPVATEVVAELEIGTVDDPPLTGLYLQTNQQGVAEKLIAVSSNQNGYWFNYGGWQGGTTLVQVIDVSDPVAPFIESRTEIDGQHITSRRIDNRLYLVTRYSPTIPGYIVPAFDPQVIDNNELLLSNVTLGDLMPDIHYDNGVDAELLNASDCYITNSSNGTNLYADLIALTVLNLDTQAAENSRCFIGATEAVYVSQQAAYLATSQYNYSINTGGALLYSNGYHTGIHKFSLQGATAVYQGSEQVEGHLGWEQDKKSFRMGEQGEHLIVATSLGETWDNTATTRLTVIKDDPVNGFATVNTLPNDSHPEKIGKPGEKLYSVRIMDGVAYLVTFRVTDPLYVIDLHNPADPFIAGELQIQGYSDYLHPLEGGLLLGVGKDAVADSSDGDNATGAWYQGIKLSLFDVNNWSNPVELNSIVIGKRGSESAVLHDHHAFTILPGNGMDVPTRIAVPVDMHDTVPPYFTGALWEWYGWTHTALYLFELDTGAGLPQLMQTGNIVAESNNGVSYYASGHRDRSVLSGAGAYYIHNQKVWSAPYQSLSQVDGPK